MGTSVVPTSSQRTVESQKFREPGYYAFDFGPHHPMAVQYVKYDGCQFYVLSNGPGEPLNLSVSARMFDEHCIGYVTRVGEDRRALEIEL